MGSLTIDSIFYYAEITTPKTREATEQSAEGAQCNSPGQRPG